MTEAASEKESSTPSGEKDPSPDATVARAAATAGGDADDAGASAPADVPRPPRPPRISAPRAPGSPKPLDAAPPSSDGPGGTVPPPPEPPGMDESERELRNEPTATEPDAPRPPAPSDEFDQQATLRQGTAAADADQANTTTRRRAPASADRTAAITPYLAEQLAAPPAPEPPSPPSPPTAERLHAEDEEGPTLIAAYPAAKPDDEATELMPSILQAPGLPLPPPVSSPQPTSHAPSPAMSPSLRQPHPLHAQLAEREAAVQAALAAAAGLGQDPEARAAQRAQRIEMAIVAVLGTAVALSALVSIAERASLHMSLAVALFLAGMASVQRVERTKLILLGLAAVVLFGTLVALALA